MKNVTGLASTLTAVAALTLVACSSGDDVYVREPSSTTSTTAPLECRITPGADMCDRTIPSVPAAEHARALAALQALSDFAWTADRMMVAITSACRTIAEETGARPYIAPQLTPEEIATIACGAAKGAIVEGGGRGMLSITASPASCVDAPARSCTTQNGKPTRVCEPGKVTVVPEPGATYSAIAVGNALSRQLGAVLALKETLESLARVTSAITGNADAIALLPEGCIAPATKLAKDSVTRIQAVITAMNQLTDAVATVQ